MNQDEIRQLNEELNFSGIARNKVKGMGHELADIVSKVELASGLTEENKLDEKTYKEFVLRQKRAIKDMITQIYAQLQLEEVEGNFDFVLHREVKKDG